jgi:hypothetical protein
MVMVKSISTPASPQRAKGTRNPQAGTKGPFNQTMLTALQAYQIYLMKPDPLMAPSIQNGGSQSRMIAELYGVSPKTIRDIWNKKTWTRATENSCILKGGSNEVSKHYIFCSNLRAFWSRSVRRERHHKF